MKDLNKEREEVEGPEVHVGREDAAWGRAGHYGQLPGQVELGPLADQASAGEEGT